MADHKSLKTMCRLPQKATRAQGPPGPMAWLGLGRAEMGHKRKALPFQAGLVDWWRLDSDGQRHRSLFLQLVEMRNTAAQRLILGQQQGRRELQ